MKTLENKKIILAVTGSIAAYKTPELVRQLIKQGANVQVLVTDAATDFVSVLSLATVSKREVLSNVSDQKQWNNHVALGLWADAMLIAPCSANTLAKLANGICDNIIQAVYLSARCPVMLAPAMDEDMWKHSSTKNNLQRVATYGNYVIAPEDGELASGLIGPGRMAEPAHIVDFLNEYFNKKIPKSPFKRALITAGPTYERIDPVRFIGNFSTGKMGIALAKELAEQGVKVTLVLGPSNEEVNHSNIELHRIESAQEMFDICVTRFETVDLAIMSAAVADFRPAQLSAEKIKKQEGNEELAIDLVKNPDILATLGHKKTHQIVVGFALETNNELQNAQHKLEKKNADYIVLNSLKDEGSGFGVDTNKVTILSKNNAPVQLPLQSKTATAKAIINFISET